ncbi:MAG: zinc-dependent metalloprotease, partial [Actinomycetota bacterium]
MPRLIDKRIASLVARRVAGQSELDGSYLMDRLAGDLGRAVPYSEELIEGASGIPAPPPVRWGVIDRATWAQVNIAGMTTLMGPVTDKISARLDALPLPAKVAQTTLVSTEVGLLLGYVSRRVLGQYDLLVPEQEDGAPGPRNARTPVGTPLYFVGPNIVETERRFGFVPRDFALWVALHEVTHRFQFEGVPWLRQRFLSLVRTYVDTVDLDARSLAKRLAAAAAKLMGGDVPPDERNPIYLLASDEQRAVLDDIQALMAVIEGHGNYVMDAVGVRVIPSLRRMRGIFDKRRDQMNSV